MPLLPVVPDVMLTYSRAVVGFFGFQHDRKVALQALAVSAARGDVHAIFAG